MLCDALLVACVAYVIGVHVVMSSRGLAVARRRVARARAAVAAAEEAAVERDDAAAREAVASLEKELVQEEALLAELVRSAGRETVAAPSRRRRFYLRRTPAGRDVGPSAEAPRRRG